MECQGRGSGLATAPLAPYDLLRSRSRYAAPTAVGEALLQQLSAGLDASVHRDARAASGFGRVPERARPGALGALGALSHFGARSVSGFGVLPEEYTIGVV